TDALQELGNAGPAAIAAIVSEIPAPEPDRVCDALLQRTAAAFSSDPAQWRDDRTVVAFALNGHP
ncbi:hypothetical protein NL526_28480, partial [Klebsiella pneumoniae]|nr:hypothetical protein [Klebsiella pneumoniae]